MKWKIGGDVQVEVTDVEQERLVVVSFSEESVLALCLGLSMLWHRLVDGVSLEGSGITIVLGRCESNEKARAVVFWRDRGASVQLSSQELEYWLNFFLRGVRDGAAEVDHIDVEADSPVANEPSGFFVLKVPSAMPPVSAEEARRRLGLD